MTLSSPQMTLILMIPSDEAQYLNNSLMNRAHHRIRG